LAWLVDLATGWLAGERRFIGEQRAGLHQGGVGGDTSPASSKSRSPGTTSLAAINSARTSRSTRARGAVIERSAAIAFPARRSWKKPTRPLMITIDRMAIASTTSWRTPETIAAPIRSRMTGLRNCSKRRRHSGTSASWATSLGPCSARRRAAKAELSPRGIIR
jgi:hypothetical protein